MQPVYVGDVAEAVMVVLCTASIKGDVFELGGPASYSFAELMHFTLKAVGRKRALINIPFAVMALPAAFASLLPNPPLTSDQLKFAEDRQYRLAPCKRIQTAWHYANID